MNETNLTEEQLRSWQPRHPAAKLKRRIFAREPGEPTTTWFVGWLVPATACALCMFLAFASGNGIHEMKPVIGVVASNQNYAAFASDGAQNVQNHLSGLTFDWTNRSVSTSSISFTPSGN